MATIESSKRLLARMWGGHAVVVERAPDVAWASPSLEQDVTVLVLKRDKK